VRVGAASRRPASRNELLRVQAAANDQRGDDDPPYDGLVQELGHGGGHEISVSASMRRCSRIAKRARTEPLDGMLMSAFDAVQAIVGAGAEWTRLGLETAGALSIAIGAITTIVAMGRALMAHEHVSFTIARFNLSRYLVLALEFQLAADILETAIAPEWMKIGQLAAIAAIRTALNYFLSREIAEKPPVVTNTAGATPAVTPAAE
jgi:uncharacterized membrane protein